MKTLKSLVLATMIVAILIGWVPIQAAVAADFTVTRTEDPSPEDPSSQGCLPEDCSLREAVIAANNDGRHDIRLSHQVEGLLTHPERRLWIAQVADLDFNDDLTIEGPTGGLRKSQHRRQRCDHG